ncbi:MAG: peptide-methionine (R)-S-oxide reductase MsrB [Marinagarivorans sp.]|nr:peptide-methionine (R)-S-oxide reductase MsrB [Marinagarivorans sp.]
MSDSHSKNDDLQAGGAQISCDEYWRDKLSPAEFTICRDKGTERAFTGQYNDFKGEGVFVCKCCAEPLFDAANKYDSGSGWPSFYATANPGCVQEYFDEAHGMRRTEIVCRRCQSHLGHVFTDGPQPTRLRYCVNSASLVLSESATSKPAK